MVLRISARADGREGVEVESGAPRRNAWTNDLGANAGARVRRGTPVVAQLCLPPQALALGPGQGQRGTGELQEVFDLFDT